MCTSMQSRPVQLLQRAGSRQDDPRRSNWSPFQIALTEQGCQASRRLPGLHLQGVLLHSPAQQHSGLAGDCKQTPGCRIPIHNIRRPLPHHLLHDSYPQNGTWHQHRRSYLSYAIGKHFLHAIVDKQSSQGEAMMTIRRRKKSCRKHAVAAEEDVEQKEQHKPSQIQHANCVPDPWTVVVVARHTSAIATQVLAWHLCNCLAY